MSTNVIYIKPQLSYIALILFILIQLSFNYILMNLLNIKLWQVSLVSLLNGYLFYIYIIKPHYCLSIDIHSKVLTTSSNRQSLPIFRAKLINIKLYSPLICIIKFSYLNKPKTVYLPLFIDSLSLKTYKQLRLLALWQ